MKFGIPYQGSKNRIAKQIIDILPSGKRLVDLFAGGCAISHCALFSGKWQSILMNDLNTSGMEIFQNALNGEFKKPEYYRWISKDEFMKLKEVDSFVKLIWSFGNNQKSYIYSENIEKLKHSEHQAIVYDDWSLLSQLDIFDVNELKKLLDVIPCTIANMKERRLKFGQYVKSKKFNEHFHCIPAIECLERNRFLEKLDYLFKIGDSSTSAKARLSQSSIDYHEYMHEDGDVVYCDPPYNNVTGYAGIKFNSDEFYKWARQQPYPVYFSEYSAPSDFKEIWSANVLKLSRTQKIRDRIDEKLFIHEKFYDEASWSKNG